MLICKNTFAPNALALLFSSNDVALNPAGFLLGFAQNLTSGSTSLSQTILCYNLIQYTYSKNIVVHWDSTDLELDFFDHMLEDFSKTVEYHRFLNDAFEIHGQNNLLDYMIDYCVKFEQDWMQSFYGSTPMPPHMKNAVTFAAGGAMYINFQWIRNGIDRPLYEVISDVIDNENRCLTPLFFDNPDDSPFEKAAKKFKMIKKD